MVTSKWMVFKGREQAVRQLLTSESVDRSNIPVTADVVRFVTVLGEVGESLGQNSGTVDRKYMYK